MPNCSTHLGTNASRSISLFVTIGRPFEYLVGQQCGMLLFGKGQIQYTYNRIVAFDVKESL